MPSFSASATGIDVGGINYINKKPARKGELRPLWDKRFKQGWCPHCGQPLHKRTGLLKHKFKPLNIPKKVDGGVCIRPDCKPPARFASDPPDVEDSDEDETVTCKYDSIMSVVEELRRQMIEMSKDVEQKRGQEKQEAAQFLEDSILQLKRTLQEATCQEEAQLRSVKNEMKGELQAAHHALNGLTDRMDQAEQGLSALDHQLDNLRGFANQQSTEIAELRARVEAVEAQNLSARLGPLEAGHTRMVNCCAVFDNGQKALSGSADNTLRVWNLVTGRTIQILTGHTRWVTCCAVFDNGQIALSGSGDKTLRVWNLATSHTIQRLEGHTLDVSCCAVFDNGQKALSGSFDNTLRVWNLATGDTFQILTGHTWKVNCCAVFDNGQKALSGSFDNTLRVWNLATGDTFQILTGHTHWVKCCAVFDNGQKALSGSFDKTLRVWNLVTGDTFQILTGHTHWVTCCAVFDNGQKALSGSTDETLRVWNLATGYTIRTMSGRKSFLFGYSLHCCAVFDNGQSALSGTFDKTLRVWDVS